MLYLRFSWSKNFSLFKVKLKLPKKKTKKNDNADPSNQYNESRWNQMCLRNLRIDEEANKYFKGKRKE